MKKIKYIIAGMIGIFGFAGIALATPSFFASGAQTSTATTTPTYLQPGTSIATTTSPVYDSYELNGTNQTNSGQINAADTATLLIQFSASSTSSILGWRYEYSQDGIDWYGDGMVARPSFASTTDYTSLNNQTWTFASSTIGGQAPSTSNNLATRIVTVPVPTRYVRAVFFLNSTTRGGVWAQFVPKKQSK